MSLQDFEIGGGLIIGDSPINKHPSAQVQFDSTEQGTLLQVMTTAQKLAIANPAIGLLVYDTDLQVFSHWNGFFWVGMPIERQTFLAAAAADGLTFLASAAFGASASGGSNLVEVADLNGVDTKARLGVVFVNISNSVGSFASLTNTAVLASARYSLSLKSKFYVGNTWSQSIQPTIDFANDPVLACVGLLAYTSTATVNPLAGVYHRLPRLGETAFVKYVVREGGVETVDNTAIPFTSNLTGFLKTALLWDGLNDTMHFITGANGVYDTKSIATFSVSYPAAFAAVHQYGIHVIRNGAGVTPVQTRIQTDTAERVIFPNFIDFV